MSRNDKNIHSEMNSETNSDIKSEIEDVLDEYVRPYLAAHGGDMKVDGVEPAFLVPWILCRHGGKEYSCDQKVYSRSVKRRFGI